MIRRWKPLPRFRGMVFSENETRRGGQAMTGSFQKNGCLVLNLSTVSWIDMMVYVSLGGQPSLIR
jgi:hypothetical protein